MVQVRAFGDVLWDVAHNHSGWFLCGQPQGCQSAKLTKRKCLKALSPAYPFCKGQVKRFEVIMVWTLQTEHQLCPCQNQSHLSSRYHVCIQWHKIDLLKKNMSEIIQSLIWKGETWPIQAPGGHSTFASLAFAAPSLWRASLLSQSLLGINVDHVETLRRFWSKGHFGCCEKAIELLFKKKNHIGIRFELDVFF